MTLNRWFSCESRDAARLIAGGQNWSADQLSSADSTDPREGKEEGNKINKYSDFHELLNVTYLFSKRYVMHLVAVAGILNMDVNATRYAADEL